MVAPEETAIAQAIKAAIAEANANATASGFVAFVEDVNPMLADPANITDQSCNAAWNFADSFFFALSHEEDDLDGLPWSEAWAVLHSVVAHLESGRPIQDARVLKYRWPRTREA